MKKQSLGSLLQAARLKAGLSLGEMARRCETAPTNIKRLEEGSGAKVAWESVCRVCEVLGLSLDEVRRKTKGQ